MLFVNVCLEVGLYIHIMRDDDTYNACTYIHTCRLLYILYINAVERCINCNCNCKYDDLYSTVSSKLLLGCNQAILKSQAHQDTSLFTSAGTNQRSCPTGSPCMVIGKLRSDFIVFPKGHRRKSSC